MTFSVMQNRKINNLKVLGMYLVTFKISECVSVIIITLIMCFNISKCSNVHIFESTLKIIPENRTLFLTSRHKWKGWWLCEDFLLVVNVTLEQNYVTPGHSFCTNIYFYSTIKFHILWTIVLVFSLKTRRGVCVCMCV